MGSEYMNTIRFRERNYLKLQDIAVEKPVKLLEVIRTKKSDLSPAFLDYDTTYQDPISKFGHAKYNLPNGILLILFFQDSNGRIFTTIRTRFKTKEKDVVDRLPYYLGLCGKEFHILFEEESKRGVEIHDYVSF